MKVKIQTMLGDIVVRLYDETPIHRDNFGMDQMDQGTLTHLCKCRLHNCKITKY